MNSAGDEAGGAQKAGGGPAGASAGAVIRPMLGCDLEEVIALAADERSAPHWPPDEYVRMLRVIEDHPHRRGAWIVRVSGEPRAPLVGFAMGLQVAGVGEVEAVVVHRDYRGQRLGERLVRAVCAWARQSGAGKVELEARASNAPALRLYARMGFVVDGTRAGYYRNPDEDAVLMSLLLG